MENESKNRVQKNKMAIISRRKRKTLKRNLKCKYLLIEKEFRYTVEEFSAQLFEMNNIIKIFFLWQNLFKLTFLLRKLFLIRKLKFWGAISDNIFYIKNHNSSLWFTESIGHR